MANNTTIQEPSDPGDIIATEDILGIKIPRNKIVLGIYGTDDGDISSTNPMPTTNVPGTTNGLLVSRSLDLNATGVSAKGSVGKIYGYYIYNNATSTRFVKFYDKATAPTQTDTPIITLPLPAGAAANVSFNNGITCLNGIGMRGTTGIADNDTGNPSTNDIVINLYYK